MTENAHGLDGLDLSLLAELQANGDLRADDLATRVGLSASAVRRRLKRLHDSGVIQGRMVVIDPRLAGIEIIVAITMKDEDRRAYDRLKRRLGSAQEVSQCYSVTGEVDLIAHVHMRDMADYETWIDETILADDAVRRCTSHVVYSRIKYSTTIPLGAG